MELSYKLYLENLEFVKFKNVNVFKNFWVRVFVYSYYLVL